MERKQRKHRRRSSELEHQSFIFRIDGWEPSYGFGLNDSRHFHGPYLEHLHLSQAGILLAPEKVRDRRATVTLVASRRETRAVADPATCDWKPLCIGELSVRGDECDYLGSLPYDAKWGLPACSHTTPFEHSSCVVARSIAVMRRSI